MNTVKMTREDYRKAIITDGKTIKQLADELLITPAAVRKKIRSLYQSKAWAEKLLGIAKSNESKENVAKMQIISSNQTIKEKKVDHTYFHWEQEFNRACKEGVAIIDTSFTLDYFSNCRDIKKLIIPRFCLNEMRKVAEFQVGEEKKETEDKIRYLEANAQIIYVSNLPFLDVRFANCKFKPRNITFARYVKCIWQESGKEIPYLTRSTEANRIIKEFIIL